MELTRFTDLALRALMRIAAQPERVTAAQLAAQVAAPPAFMAKVVTRLSGMELVDARRGRTGGLTLAPGVLERSVGGIVRELEAGPVIDCLHPEPCPLLTGGCLLRAALGRAQEAFYASLDPIRLRDLVPAAAARPAPRRRHSPLPHPAPTAPRTAPAGGRALRADPTGNHTTAVLAGQEER
ncbi:transcriptional regulator [Brevibacterium sp. 5221]|uniref:Transcriptional regulator n=1 Tax=Brevibacterium rongguiense TaxID=2695267 RepID=A0A6N9H6K3_9MICO|nr:Rrf2 family transcriptional regulator [Brevibacterium rongguiense]MYM19698.1 transcriptional regulator [Brevibacterium rongguiense]